MLSTQSRAHAHAAPCTRGMAICPSVQWACMSRPRLAPRLPPVVSPPPPLLPGGPGACCTPPPSSTSSAASSVAPHTHATAPACPLDHLHPRARGCRCPACVGSSLPPMSRWPAASESWPTPGGRPRRRARRHPARRRSWRRSRPTGAPCARRCVAWRRVACGRQGFVQSDGGQRGARTWPAAWVNAQQGCPPQWPRACPPGPTHPPTHPLSPGARLESGALHVAGGNERSVQMWQPRLVCCGRLATTLLATTCPGPAG